MTKGYRRIDGKRYLYGGTFKTKKEARSAVKKYKTITASRQKSGFYRGGKIRRFARVIPRTENGKRVYVVWVREIGTGK